MSSADEDRNRMAERATRPYRRPDRRRRPCRPVAGAGAPPGRARPCGDAGRRRAARGGGPRQPRLGDRRGRPAHARPARRLGGDRRRRAADHRDGDHRQPHRRCRAAGLPDLRRTGRATASPSPTWWRTATWSARCARRAEAAGVRHRSRPDSVDDFTIGRADVACRLGSGRTIAGAAAGRRRRRPLAAARPRRHRHGRLALRPVGHRRHRRARAARTTAGRRSISCPAGRSPSCRSRATARRWCGPSATTSPGASSPATSDVFRYELERRFGHQLGAITPLGRPRAFPLGLTLARAFVSDALRACRRRGPRHPPDRRAGPQSRLPRRRRAGRDDRRGAPPRPRYRLAAGARALPDAGGGSTRSRWAS